MGPIEPPACCRNIDDDDATMLAGSGIELGKQGSSTLCERQSDASAAGRLSEACYQAFHASICCLHLLRSPKHVALAFHPVREKLAGVPGILLPSAHPNRHGLARRLFKSYTLLLNMVRGGISRQELSDESMKGDRDVYNEAFE